MRVRILGLVLLNATLIFFTPVFAAGAVGTMGKSHIEYPANQKPKQVEGENSVAGNACSTAPSIHANLALGYATVMAFDNRGGTSQAQTSKLK